MCPLTIYKASAGSGKTYQLTLSYLLLLFKNPEAYRHILAVTFTNKAAKEMKKRVLDRLFEISVLKPGESSDDLEQFVRLTGLSNDEIIRISGNLLTRILNDYSRFSISTIDKFFQKIIRSFALELGLTPGYSIEIDQSRILSESVDMLYENLDDDVEMRNWILQLAESRIQEAKSWRYHDDILDLSNELFKEKFQEITLKSEEVLSRDKINELKRKIEDMLKNSMEEIRSISRATLKALTDEGYSELDFHKKSRGIPAFIKNISEGGPISFTDTRKAAIDSVEKWLSEKDRLDDKKSVFVNKTLMPALKGIYEHYLKYNSAFHVKKHLYSLGILSDISKNIASFATLKNVFLISDTARFLRGLIADNPTPFIYEKTGSYIDHIMLDEFQDTSVFQWENFQPLLNHTLSGGNENIVVGDVKQSIYRWRNSDWKILANSIKSTFAAFDPNEKNLSVNWRSFEKIIQFNNFLFSKAPAESWNLVSREIDNNQLQRPEMKQLHDIFMNAYAEVAQSVPQKKKGTGGFVQADLIDSQNKDGFTTEALRRLPEWISQLQNSGYRPGDIAILVRQNKEGAEIAKRLMEAKREAQYVNCSFEFISNDSLFIDQHPSIKFLVSLLKYILDPSDVHNNMNLLYFHRLISKENTPAEKALYPENDIKKELGEDFFKMIPGIKRIALFEATEKLINHFELNLDSDNVSYIQAFQEVVYDMQKKDASSLHDFLSYWQENGKKKTISVSELQDAISISTIHKAKGLQYKAVIMPFVGWKMVKSSSGKNRNIIWCDTEGTSFNMIPSVPVNYSGALTETIFAPAYTEELVMECIDNLNLLYVGLTRAEEAVILGLQVNKSKNSTITAGEIINEVLQSDSTDHELNMEFHNEAGHQYYQLGSLETKPMDDSSNTDISYVRYPVHTRNAIFRLKLKSKLYTAQNQLNESPIEHGNLMHEIFANIITAGDVSKAVRKFHSEGIISESELKSIITDLDDKFNNPLIKEWFSGEYKYYREQELVYDGKIYRPDRVMIQGNKAVVLDYKFGNYQEDKHKYQVEKYLDILKGFKSYTILEGYLWYVSLNEIVKVEMR